MTCRNEKYNEKGIDYVLLSCIPNLIYDNIAKYGKNINKIHMIIFFFLQIKTKFKYDIFINKIQLQI